MIMERKKICLSVGLLVMTVSTALLTGVPSGRASDPESDQAGYFLVDIFEDNRELPEVSRIPISPRATSESAQEIYEIRIPLLKGDLLYLEGQAEVTNPIGTNVMLGVAIRTVEGDLRKRISHWSTANLTRDMHHMPLRVSAKYVAERDGETVFMLTAHAASDSPIARGKDLQVERGYGHLLVEVFRPRHTNMEERPP